MLLRDLVAVAEHFCHERCRDFFDEPAQGCVACAQEIDADFPQTNHESVGVDVLPGPVSGEQSFAA